MKESAIQIQVRLALSQAGSVVFRNNVGAYKTLEGRWIRYGVCNPGGSDLIGWTSIEVTPDMIGKRVAVFTAAETKTSRGKTTGAQQNFIDQIVKAGGIAGVCRSADDATALVRVSPSVNS